MRSHNTTLGIHYPKFLNGPMTFQWILRPSRSETRGIECHQAKWNGEVKAISIWWRQRL